MQVVAVMTPSRPEWRWRIVNYAGEILEESHETFRSIAAAVSEGGQRLREINGPPPVATRASADAPWTSSPRRSPSASR